MDSIDNDDKNSIKHELANWAVKHNIIQNAISDLLKMLNGHSCFKNELPIDARTLMKTNVSSTVFSFNSVPPGHYYHFGIENGIKNYYDTSNPDPVIKLVFGIDGLQLTKSSNSVFWPILCYIRPNNNIVFPIGIFWGNNKPHDSNIFLAEFFKEMKQLILNGIFIKTTNNKLIKKEIVLDVFCCDTPAKAFVLKTKYHSGYFSCPRCYTEGIYYKHKVCFPELNCPKRTHDNFKNKDQEEYHVGDSMSILLDLPNIDIIKVFSIDYMHNLCLGIQRQLLHLWLNKGPLTVRIPGFKINIMSEYLISLKNMVPCDFQRKPRGLNELNRWKATEFRLFLIYTGPIVLKFILDDKCYFNFLCLNVSIFILLGKHKQYTNQLTNYTKSLINYFIEQFIIIYGKEWMSHNMHCLQHIHEDFINFDSLDNCSAFPFENYMKVLKKFVRKSGQPLQQTVKRYTESIIFNTPIILNIKNSEKYQFKQQHTSGPMINNCSEPQYKKMIFNKIVINTNNNADCFIGTFLFDIVKVVNICTNTSNDHVILGLRYLTKDSFYLKPIDSSMIGIYIVSNLDLQYEMYNINSIKVKYMVLKIKDMSIALPINHTYVVEHE